MKPIRLQYEDLGIEGFYRSNVNYENFHKKNVRELLEENHQNLPLYDVLDMSAGDGLVTTTLQSLDYQNIEGSDPYLSDLYTKNTGLRCMNLDFKSIVMYGLPKKYSCVICSFALHLCEKSMLPSLLWRISESTTSFVVISPSKFPFIGEPSVEKFSLTQSKKRVHYRVYYK